MEGFETSGQQTKSAESFDSGQPTDDNQVFLKVGERAFAKPEDAARYVEHSSTHISKLEEENRLLREAQDKLQHAADDNVTVRELLEGMRNAATTSTPPSATPSVSKEELVAEAVKIATTQVREELKSEQQLALEKTNLNEAMTAAQEEFGEQFIEEVGKIGTQHGLTGVQINNLAKQSPKAFAKLFLKGKSASSGPSGGEYNTSAFQQSSQIKRPSIMSVTDNKSRARIVQERIAERLATLK